VTPATTAEIRSRRFSGTSRSALCHAAPTCLLLVVVLVVPGGARASDASLRSTLATWSHRIAADARGIGLSASRGHPRRMTSRARQFRLDALTAKRELSAQRPSTLRGRRARRLAVAAFGDFAVVGSQWALSGVARLHHRNALADRHARIATRYAAAGNHLFIAASRLLRA
jgi:hypothetical protein